MWELVSFVKGQMRTICLEELEKGPKTPTAIVESTGKHLSHVSRALRELNDKELVKCLTPNQQKNRIYEITLLGKKVIQKLHEISN